MKKLLVVAVLVGVHIVVGSCGGGAGGGSADAASVPGDGGAETSVFPSDAVSGEGTDLAGDWVVELDAFAGDGNPSDDAGGGDVQPGDTGHLDAVDAGPGDGGLSDGTDAGVGDVGLDVQDTTVPPDADGDGVADAGDNCPSIPNEDQADFDGDKSGDACDDDDDGDGVVDGEDAFPLDPDEWSDVDGDGIGDNADIETCDGIDNDGDGVADNGLDVYELYPDPDGDGQYGMVPSDVQPSCAALLAEGETADGVFSIDPDGEGGFEPLQVYCDMTRDGGGWTLVFHHDIADGYWAGNGDSIERSIEDPMALRYSILSHLEALRSSDGSFEMRIEWPQTACSGHNIWRQTSNPTTEPVAGYQALEIDYTDYSWGGLEFNSFNSSSFIDGSVGIAWWFYAIGSTAAWSDPPGIPACSLVPAARVSLWVRPDDAVQGGPPPAVLACGPYAGLADVPGDCDPDDAAVYAGADEVCDGKDNDCDGEKDEGFTYEVWYPDADGDGIGAGAGSSCTSLFGQGKAEDGVYPVRPAALGGPQVDVYCDMTTDGGGWTRVFYHDVAGGYFASDADAASSNVDDPLAMRYSILDQLEAFRSSDGRFELRIDWPGTPIPGRNIWSQQSNPTAGPVAGYQAGSIDYTSQYWGGLEPANNTATYLDGSVNHGNWFYSIGSQVAWGDPKGIPAHGPSAARVELWVRNDDDVAGGETLYDCKKPEGYVNISGDCDDTNDKIFAGQVEACNGLDDDCDGEADEGCPFGSLGLTSVPQPLHFYPRNLKTGTCTFTVEGETLGVATEASVRLLQDGKPFGQAFVGGGPVFAVPVTFDAGLNHYDVVVEWDNGSGWWKPVTTVKDVVCGDVFLVDGQSNAVASDYHGEQLGDQDVSPFVRSFGDSVNGPSAANDVAFGLAVGNTAYTHGGVGQWGLHLARTIMETQKMPILLINGAVGGTTVLQHQRNDANTEDLNTIYGRLLWRVRKAGVDGSVRAIFWHQGESDGAMAYDAYLALWTAMYTDWLEDYPNVEGIYPFQVRAGCGNPTWNRNVHRDLPGLLPKVIGHMSTTGISGHDGCHFYHSTYVEWGERMARLVNRDLYGTDVPGNIEAPDPVKATWLDAIQLEIDYGASGGGLVLQPGSEAFFSLSNGAAIKSAKVVGSAVVLTAAKSGATWVSFVDPAGDIAWLVNDLGIGGFAYYQLPITP